MGECQAAVVTMCVSGWSPSGTRASSRDSTRLPTPRHIGRATRCIKSRPGWDDRDFIVLALARVLKLMFIRNAKPKRDSSRKRSKAVYRSFMWYVGNVSSEWTRVVYLFLLHTQWLAASVHTVRQGRLCSLLSDDHHILFPHRSSHGRTRMKFRRSDCKIKSHLNCLLL